jgi:putative flippase GtrA
MLETPATKGRAAHARASAAAALSRVPGRRFVTYLLVGGLNTVFGYGAFAVLFVAGLHYAAAAALATVLGVLFNFQTTGRIVFKSRDPSLLFRFVGVYGVMYVVNVGALRLLQGKAEVLLVQACLVLPMAALSFVLHQRFTFGAEVAEP